MTADLKPVLDLEALKADVEAYRSDWHARMGTVEVLDRVLALIARVEEAEGVKTQAGFTPTHRHVARGTEYEYLGWGRAQCSESGLMDDEHVAIYRGRFGDLWARRLAEFSDGRFETLPAPAISADLVEPVSEDGEHTAEGCPVLSESDPPCDGCDCHKRHDLSPPPPKGEGDLGVAVAGSDAHVEVRPASQHSDGGRG